MSKILVINSDKELRTGLIEELSGHDVFYCGVANVLYELAEKTIDIVVIVEFRTIGAKNVSLLKTINSVDQTIDIILTGEERYHEAENYQLFDYVDTNLTKVKRSVLMANTIREKGKQIASYERLLKVYEDELMESQKKLAAIIETHKNLVTSLI